MILGWNLCVRFCGKLNCRVTGEIPFTGNIRTGICPSDFFFFVQGTGFRAGLCQQGGSKLDEFWREDAGVPRDEVGECLLDRPTHFVVVVGSSLLLVKVIIIPQPKVFCFDVEVEVPRPSLAKAPQKHPCNLSFAPGCRNLNNSTRQHHTSLHHSLLHPLATKQHHGFGKNNTSMRRINCARRTGVGAWRGRGASEASTS